jgi:WD40 repeat protein
VSGSLLVHRCDSGAVERSIGAHAKPVVGICAFSDGTIASIGGATAMVWDLEKGSSIDEHDFPNAPAAVAATSGGGRLVGVGKLSVMTLEGPQLRTGYGSSLEESARHLWSSKTTSRRHATAIACADDGRCAIADAGGIVDLYDTNTRKFFAIVFAHSHSIGAIAVDPASRYVVTAGADRVLRVWKFPARK